MSKALDKWIHLDVFNNDEDSESIPEYTKFMGLAMIAAAKIGWRYPYVSLRPGESSGLYLVGESSFGGIEAIARHENPATAVCMAIYKFEKGIDWEEPDELAD